MIVNRSMGEDTLPRREYVLASDYDKLRAAVLELLACGGPISDVSDPSIWASRYVNVVTRIRNLL